MNDTIWQDARRVAMIAGHLSFWEKGIRHNAYCLAYYVMSFDAERLCNPSFLR